MAQENEIILKLKLQEAGFKVGIKKLKEDLKTVGNFSDEYKLKVAKLNLEEQKLINTRKKLSQATDQLIGNNKQGLNGVSKASGSATAAAMELGRVVSDAPYGIRGMANNVSQLASQLFFMAGQQETATVATKSSTVATTTDTVAKGVNTTATVVATGATIGFTGAVKMMWSALMGPMGVLLAIQAVIASLDFFYGANKKAEKGVNEFNDSASKSASNLKILKRALEDGTLSTEEANRAVKKANEEYVGLNLQLNENNKLTEDSVGFIDDKINAIERLAKAQAIQSLLENQYAIIGEAKTKLDAELAEKGLNLKDLDIRKEKERAALEGKTGVRRRKIVRDFLTQNEKVANGLVTSFREIEKKGNDAITSLMSQLSETNLVDELFKGNDPKGKTKLLEIKDFDKQVEDYLSQIASVSEKEEILNATLNSDKVRIQAKYHLKRLGVKNEENKAKFKQQSDAYRIEYEAFLNQEVRLTNLTQGEADKKLNKFDKDAKTQQDKSDANYKILLSKWKSYYFNKSFEALSGEMKVAETEEDANTKRLKSITDFIEQYKVLTSAVNDFIQAESERELTIEKNKTNVLNTELNNRLNNENLSAEQRKSIQDEILRNDEKLRVKQNAIKKKAFMTQKAFNISTAIVNTVSAGIGAAAATYGGPLAKLAAMTAVIGAGMAQVAIIARQKFQPEAANTPVNTGGGGSSSGGSSVRSEPSFNIVGGRTKEDALLGAIQAQFDQPLKAYVVSGDVTSQQELDRVIVSSSSL